MKKSTSFSRGLLSALGAIILFSVIIVGCKKETQQEIIYEDPAKLSEDKAFIKLTYETNDFLVSFADHIKRNNINKMDVLSSLSKLESKPVDYTQQKIDINYIFKGNVSDGLQNLYQTTNSLWNDIKKRYNNIPNEVLEKECLEVLSNRNFTESGDLVKQKPAYMEKEAGGCGWRYYLCMGAATAAAIGCHAACEGSAIALTAGMGIPACVVLCATVQTYMAVECADKWCSKN